MEVLQDLSNLRPPEQLLLITEEKTGERLRARYPLSSEGVVKERLMEERDAIAVLGKDMLGDEHVRVVDQVSLIEYLDGDGQHLAITSRVGDTTKNFVEPQAWPPSTCGLPLAFPERLEQ